MRKIEVTIGTKAGNNSSCNDQRKGLNFLMKADSLTDFLARQALLLTILADSGVEVEQVTAYSLNLLEPGISLSRLTEGLEERLKETLQLLAQSISAKTDPEKPNEEHP